MDKQFLNGLLSRISVSGFEEPGQEFLKEYMNNSFSEKEEIEEFLQVSCLGVIPNFE